MNIKLALRLTERQAENEDPGQQGPCSKVLYIHILKFSGCGLHKIHCMHHTTYMYEILKEKNNMFLNFRLSVFIPIVSVIRKRRQ